MTGTGILRRQIEAAAALAFADASIQTALAVRACLPEAIDGAPPTAEAHHIEAACRASVAGSAEIAAIERRRRDALLAVGP